MDTMKICVTDNRKSSAQADVAMLRGRTILPVLAPVDCCGAGVVITPLHEQDGYLCASAILPDGIVTQRALSLNARYRYQAGEALETFLVGDTPCAILTDVDALRPEPYRALAMRGVRVVFCVRLIDPAKYNDALVLFGPWSNAQANGLFVVDCNNVEFNAICPCALTADNSGFLVRGGTDDGCFVLPLSRYYEGLRSFPVFQSLHSPLYRAYFGGKTR